MTHENETAGYADKDIRDLIAAYPLAWVCSMGGSEARLLPLVGVYDENGKLVELIGHLVRESPLALKFVEDPRVNILFTGPHSYISPSQAGRRNWGPTWNYAQIQIQAEISVEPELTPESLEVLVEHVEKDMALPWRIEELGPRYEMMLPKIIGFRVKIQHTKAIFKLGQDENLETLKSILSTLPKGDLFDWMCRFNQKRLEVEGK